MGWRACSAGPEREALAVLQLQPQRPQARLPGGRLARRRRQRQLDLAQPAARVLYHRLVTWKLDVTDVSRMAGHASYRITLDMYVGGTAGVLDRARQATE